MVVVPAFGCCERIGTAIASAITASKPNANQRRCFMKKSSLELSYIREISRDPATSRLQQTHILSRGDVLPSNRSSAVALYPSGIGREIHSVGGGRSSDDRRRARSASRAGSLDQRKILRVRSDHEEAAHFHCATARRYQHGAARLADRHAHFVLSF